MLRILLAVLFISGAAPALAAPRTAPPPPSGKVIHLFGPQGVLANAIPLPGITPAPPPAGPPPAGPPPAGSPAAPGTVASAAPPSAVIAAPAAAQSYPEPTLGAVLHQMFVTGDPNAGPGFPQGRKGN